MGLDISVSNRNDIEIYEVRLGNVGQITRIHNAVGQYPDLFPLILEKVTYSGAHCGDEIAAEDVSALLKETIQLGEHLIAASDLDKSLIAEFAQTLRDACLIAIEHGTIIQF